MTMSTSLQYNLHLQVNGQQECLSCERPERFKKWLGYLLSIANPDVPALLHIDNHMFVTSKIDFWSISVIKREWRIENGPQGLVRTLVRSTPVTLEYDGWLLGKFNIGESKDEH